MLTAAEIRALLRRLDGEPADAIESETLECKHWDPNPSARDSQYREIRETVVCLANTRGGTIVLGVTDKKRTRRAALQGVGTLDGNDLRRRMYDGTEPHILVDIEELVEPEGRLLLIRVPRGMPPHTTTEGVGKIRIGKECKPLTGSALSRLLFAGGQRDLTAEVVPGVTPHDLDPDQIELLRRTIDTEGGSRGLVGLLPAELLQNLGLVHDGEVTLAALLLVGRTAILSRHVPQHEVIFVRFKTQTRYDVRHDLRDPLLATLDALKRLLDAHLRIASVEVGGFGELTLPDLTWWAAREAVLNALVHRDYFLRQSIHLELHSDRFDVASPGGFIGGVTVDNVLRHPPARRNPFLADVCQSIGLVNRAGVGVDRIWEELLRLGKGVPRYDADESHVRLSLPMRTHEAFARFVAEEARAGRQLELDDLIALRAATDRGFVDRWSAAERLQLSEEEAAARLIALRARGFLAAFGRGRGTTYRLVRHLSDRLRGPGEADREIPLDTEALRLRIQAVLAERGRVTNADIRRLSGYSRGEVLRLMRFLKEQGIAIPQGRGRAAHYIPSPRVSRARSLQRRGRK